MQRVGCVTADGDAALMHAVQVVGFAQGHQIGGVVVAAMRSVYDVMHVQYATATTGGDCASAAIASENGMLAKLAQGFVAVLREEGIEAELKGFVEAAVPSEHDSRRAHHCLEERRHGCRYPEAKADMGAFEGVVIVTSFHVVEDDFQALSEDREGQWGPHRATATRWWLSCAGLCAL